MSDTNDDDLGHRLKPGKRQMMATLVAAGEAAPLADWLLETEIVRTVYDAVRLYAPDPRLNLLRQDTTDWKQTAWEAHVHPEWPYNLWEARQMEDLIQAGQRYAIARYEFLEEITRKNTRPREALLPPLAEEVLAHLLRSFGLNDEANQVESLARSDEIMPELPTEFWALDPQATAPFGMHLPDPVNRNKYHFVGYERKHYKCAAPATLGPNAGYPQGEESGIWLHPIHTLRPRAEDTNPGMQTYQIRPNQENAVLRSNHCGRCGRVHWSCKKDDPRCQPGTKRLVLAESFFENMVFTNRMTTSDMEMRLARDDADAIRIFERWYHAAAKDHLVKPWRSQAAPHIRHDGPNRRIIVEQRLRPLDLLTPPADQAARGLYPSHTVDHAGFLGSIRGPLLDELIMLTNPFGH
jgi:hypothetical protein